MSNFSLATLLDPIGVERFLASHWEQSHLHVARNDPDYYRELLSAANIDDLIAHGDGRYPAIRLARDGAFFPPEAYTRNVRYGDESFNGVPDVEKIFTEYLSGATVTLPALHRTWLPLGLLCLALESRLDHAVHANAYVTPANAAGFTAHYDTHEVFVPQIAGEKHWQIFAPPLHLPHRTQTFSPERHAAAGPALAELRLRAGDLLYLPRGYLHSTTTSGSFSAHVTVGITVYTWVELALELLQGCGADARFRRALPPGFASTADVQQDLARELSELIASWCQRADYEQIVASFLQRVRATRSRAPGTFRADVSVIGPTTLLGVVTQRRYALSEEREHAVLMLDERRVLLPPATRPALQVICSGTPFSAAALPGALSLDARLALVRYLHGLGLVGPCG